MGGTPVATLPPLGALPLPAPMEGLRRAAAALGHGPIARRMVSVIRRVILWRRADPVDVEVFPGRTARLYPRDNLSEKRAFAGPQFWDREERAALARAIAMYRGDRPFAFVDAGANAGLYSLYALSAARGPLTVVAVEPEPETCARLRVNLDVPARPGQRVVVVQAALAAAPGSLRLTPAGANRGEVRVAAAGEAGVEVEALTLAQVAQRTGLSAIDALKIDIEGAEAPVLDAFFAAAPAGLWPRLVILEAPRGAETGALGVLRRRGYAIAARTKLNAVLTAPPGTAPRGAAPQGTAPRRTAPSTANQEESAPHGATEGFDGEA